MFPHAPTSRKALTLRRKRDNWATRKVCKRAGGFPRLSRQSAFTSETCTDDYTLVI